MSAAASNAVIHLRREYLIIGDPMWFDTWGGRMPDTAASAAASNGAIYLCREYPIIGVPMWLDTWGEKKRNYFIKRFNVCFPSCVLK